MKKNDIEDTLFIEDDEEDTISGRFLTFLLGNEYYGIPIRYILEIIEIQEITEVPNMPAYYKGVINLRGKVLPVMDLRLRFNLPERAFDDRTCIIVCEINNSIASIIVDTVEEVVEIPKENIEPPPKFNSLDSKNRYISGMGKIGDRVVINLDMENIFSEQEIVSKPVEQKEQRETCEV
jgi:purine-binding chemotaxis protein CheW